MVIGFGGRVAVVLSLATPIAAFAPVSGSTSEVEVVVQATSQQAAAAAVSATGGHVLVAMPALGVLAAEVPSGNLAALSARPGIRSVTPDRPMSVADTGTQSASLTVSGTPSVYRAQMGADRMNSSGYTGSGAVVALVDTGVTPVDDLAGRLVTGLENPADPSGPPVNCINFSGDDTCSDGYGHGTFMAGLIAGTGADSGGQFTGVAPGAQIINLKVAKADGSTDLVRVLAAMDWAISFRQQYGISVMNLSLGTTATSDPTQNVLDQAAEDAWQAGIAVVAAAGNTGPATGTITAPGDDPMIITAGAVDDQGSTNYSNDISPTFTSRGPSAGGAAKPDVVASGANIIGLQAPGSQVYQIPTEPDLTAPNFSGAYRRGSGTSMAAAITSGVAALEYAAWSHQPGFSTSGWPNRLKSALVNTASGVASSDHNAVGAGLVNAVGAVFTAGSASGTSSSGAASGFSPSAWYSGPFSGQSWEGQSWEGQSWEGQSWEGQSWEGLSWEGQSWEGQSWEGLFN